jgi:hypothetical protein
VLEQFNVAYHGTIDVYSEKIMDNIDIKQSRYFTDFGRGFYVTSNELQARDWAMKKWQDNQAKFPDCRPSIIRLLIDTEGLKLCNGLVYSEPSDNWAEFVYNCRNEGRNDKLYHEYDFVCGALADGKIVPLMNLKQRGKIAFDEFYRQIKPRSLENQLSFHTRLALEYIQNKEVLIIGEANRVR